MAVSYFLSDVHIKDNQDINYIKLNQFLEKDWLSHRGDVYLLGDIFDLWVSNHQIFVHSYKRLIHNLIQVKQKGFKVVYFEGNHDLHLNKFWHQELGFEVQREIKTYSIEGLKFRLEHGDLINSKDLAYLRLRRFLRTPTMTFLAHTLPGLFWKILGQKWSHESRKNSRRFKENKTTEIIEMIRNYAENQDQDQNQGQDHDQKQKHDPDRDPFDVMITGHMHVKDTYEFQKNNETKISINLGSWFEEPSILKFERCVPGNSLKNFSWIKCESP